MSILDQANEEIARLRARIADLEAAQVWEPAFENFTIVDSRHMARLCFEDGKLIFVRRDQELEFTLPDDHCVARRRLQEGQ